MNGIPKLEHNNNNEKKKSKRYINVFLTTLK